MRVIASRQKAEVATNMEEYDGDWTIDLNDSRFEIRPHPTYNDLMKIYNYVKNLGYEMPYSKKQYSLEEVQQKLREVGQAAFLNQSELQHDVLAKATLEKTEDLVAKRLTKLAPADHLIITDPYLFPSHIKKRGNEYAERLCRLIVPILKPRSRLTCIVNSRSDPDSERLTKTLVEAEIPGVTFEVHKRDDFHDRFWIADGNRGIIVGTSLNELGRKIFLIDQLKKEDILVIVDVIRNLGIGA